MFKLERNENLDDLAFEFLFRREEESASQLHGQGGTALCLLAGRHISHSGLKQTPVVHATMLEEAPILDCQDRLHKVRRNFVIIDQSPLRSIDVFAQARDEQGLEFIA